VQRNILNRTKLTVAKATNYRNQWTYLSTVFAYSRVTKLADYLSTTMVNRPPEAQCSGIDSRGSLQTMKLPLLTVLSSFAAFALGLGCAEVAQRATRLAGMRSTNNPSLPSRPFDRSAWIRDDADQFEKIAKRSKMVSSLTTKLTPGTRIEEILSLLGRPDEILVQNSLPQVASSSDMFEPDDFCVLSYVVGYDDNSTGILKDVIPRQLDLFFSSQGRMRRFLEGQRW